MSKEKPLGGKAYGSIPHLPNSRLGPGDHSATVGMARICCDKPRDKHDIIIVTEKVDGSCMAVAKINDRIVPLTRAGWAAESSPYKQHHLFSDWVYRNEQTFRMVVPEGGRVVGEWLAQAHGTLYKITNPYEAFVAFDLFDYGGDRYPYIDFLHRVNWSFIGGWGLKTARLISYGLPVSVETIKKRLEPSGHNAIDPVEGAVWRVERKGEVDFLAKWVRHDKVDGKYFPEEKYGEPIWNWHPECSRRKA